MPQKPTDPLRDPRSRRADALADRADRARRRGREAEARELFGQAAALNAAVVAQIGSSFPRVLAVNTVMLWIKAGQRARGLDAAEAFLREPARLHPEGVDELRRLREVCREEIRRTDPLRWRAAAREAFYPRSSR
jgi:hypothetical protein